MQRRPEVPPRRESQVGEILARKRLWTVIEGDCLDRLRGLPAGYFQTCVTSPPYWGLRDYGVAGQIGLESTPEEYVERLVAVFREVRRVLRADGTLWLNLGDCYATGAGKVRNHPGGGKQGERWKGPATQPNRMPLPRLKPKDLVGIPWRVALTLQADGWYLRNATIWAKPNGLPTSVRDRLACKHEYVFLLAKSRHYFFDLDAIREPFAPSTIRRARQRNVFTQPGGRKQQELAAAIPPAKRSSIRSHREIIRSVAKQLARHKTLHDDTGSSGRLPPEPGEPNAFHPLGRNPGDVWTIPTQPFKKAHFAVFPPKLVEPCIKAGTSRKGACPKCGSPWERVVEREFHPQADVSKERGFRDAAGQKPMDVSNGWQGFPRGTTEATTKGWRPSCSCDAGDSVPQTVLDPFCGAGTTGLVALRHGRRFIGIELNPEYVRLAHERIHEEDSASPDASDRRQVT